MTGTTRYLLLLVLVFFSACATIRNCPIETLQPAKITFEKSGKSIAICAPQTLLSDAVMSNDGAVSVPADSLIANILFSLQHAWKETPGYEDTEFYTYIIKSDELPGASNFDMVVRLDKLQVKNTYYGQEYSYFEWEAYLHVQYVAKWSIRNKSGALIDDFTARDLIIWPSGIRSGKSDAVMSLPDIKNAWWDMGIEMAQNYATRITPHWRTEVREIYMINKYPELSQKAHTAMQNDGFARAFDIWENMLLSCRKSGQKRVKSQITHNMAVAYEFQNQLDQALYWIQRSANISQKNRTVDYLNLLRERKQQQLQLDQQTAP